MDDFGLSMGMNNLDQEAPQLITIAWIFDLWCQPPIDRANPKSSIDFARRLALA
jgi:hypothetical protein